MKTNDSLIDVDAGRCQEDMAWIAEALSNGKVIVIRNVDALKHFRQQLLEYAASLDEKASVRNELEHFLDNKVEPSVDSVWCLTEAIKLVRSAHYLTLLLAPLISKMGFPEPVRIHNGLPRLVFEPDTVAAARESGRFDEEDFRRIGKGKLTEIFMPGYANIHRDFNRPHSLFMCNVWFTLYDAEPDEVLRIWPEYYHGPYLDMANTYDNAAKLGTPLEISLKQGDLVLFHSEHIHSSPLHGNDRRRFSYDLRIASHCMNDVTHYRQDFVNIANLLPLEKRGALPVLNTMHSLLEGVDPLDIDIEYTPSLEWSRLKGLACSDPDTARILAERFHVFPFDEERTLMLAEYAVLSDAEYARKLLSEVEYKASSPFWLLQVVRFMNKHGMKHETAGILKQIIDVSADMAMPDYAPVHYRNGANESFPEDWIHEATMLLEQLQCSEPGTV